MEVFMNILKSNLGPFLLQVGIPFVVAVGAAFAVYAGYSNLKSQIETQKDLEAKAEQINKAFTKIGVQEEVLLGQKKELIKQQEITTNLHVEYTRQKEFNELLNKIQVLSLGAKNSSRKDFESFYSLVEGDILNSELHDIWEKEYNYLRKQWEGELENVNFYRLIDTKTGKSRKWSQEYLYMNISSLWTNRSWAFNNKDYAAYFKEIEINKLRYFVETLYKIATEGENISYSILAAKTLCSITDFEPYPSHQFANSDKQLLNDIPEFKKLREWWDKSGSKNTEYTCPLEKIVENDRNYYSYDRSYEGKDLERLKLLDESIKNYPNLSRSKAEIAYIKLNGLETYQEVERLANEAIIGTDMESLPYLLIAFIGLKQNDMNKLQSNLNLAKQSMNLENMITSIQINPKLHELFNALDKLKMLD